MSIAPVLNSVETSFGLGAVAAISPVSLAVIAWRRSQRPSQVVAASISAYADKEIDRQSGRDDRCGGDNNGNRFQRRGAERKERTQNSNAFGLASLACFFSKFSLIFRVLSVASVPPR